MNDIITKDQVLTAYNSAPDLVRATFNDEATTQTLVELQAKFQIQVDSASILGKEVGYLLLGLTDPNTFTNRLKNSGFSEQVVTEIAKEITQKIFVPLREKMRNEGVAIPEPVKPVMPPVPPTPPREAFRPFGQPTQANPQFAPRPTQINATMPNYSGGKPQPASAQGSGEAKYFHLENKIPAPAVPPAPNEKLLEDHEEPHIEFRQAPTPANPARTAPPPPNLPGVIPEVRPSPELLKVEPQIPIAQPKPVPPISIPARPYSSDPYREPIDTP